MRTLEHRRHSSRDPSGLRLNAAGRALARKVGSKLAKFDRVVTSPKPRAIETAEAMGFVVDASLPALGEMPADAGVPLDSFRPRTFDDFARMVEESAAARTFAREQATIWARELGQVREGGALLLISHSGIIEVGAVAALPRIARTWGEPLGYLEGVRLLWDRGRWVSGEVLRV